MIRVHTEYLGGGHEDLYQLNFDVNSRLVWLVDYYKDAIDVISVNIDMNKREGQPIMSITYKTKDKDILERGRL